MNSPRYLLFAGLFLLVTLWMLRDFLPGVVWGGVFAISLWPLHRHLQQRSRGRVTRPALAFSILFALVILLPLIYVAFTFVHLYSQGSSFLAAGSTGKLAAPGFLAALPYGEKWVALWQERVGDSTSLIEALVRLSQGQLASWLSSAAVRLSADLATTLCMLVSFYYMLRHGQWVEAHHREILGHWLGAQSVPIIEKGISALRGTINGVVLIGLLEGVLLAVPLVLAGITSGLLLGLVAGIAGVIPLVMPALILPCIAYLYFQGETLFAILTAIDLAVVWLVFENIVKPGIISSAVKVNPWLVLLGLIGGLQMMGPVGLFVGPALVAMATGMIRDLALPPVHSEH